MRKLLLILGIAISAVGPTWWALAGANMGWTKTRVMTTVKDPVTEIEQPVWQDKFVPGLDFLILTDGIGVSLVIGSLIGRKKSKT
jgi:hypothetical protein